MPVQFLYDYEIEEKAEELLIQVYGSLDRVTYPVDVDHICEFHLGYEIKFADLNKKPGDIVVLGSTNFAEKVVYIDVSLGQTARRGEKGCYRFTLSHEMGHVVLPGKDEAVFPQGVAAHQAKFGIGKRPYPDPEYQANYFAGAVLMPRGKITEVYSKAYDRYFCPDLVPGIANNTVQARRLLLCDLQEQFEVNRKALTIRLKKLGLNRHLIH